MPVTAVVGAQWGDEGKGKITDLIAAEASIVIRYQGGTNAGHTVRVGDELFKLHLIPSGILYPHVTCLMADGTLIDPVALVDEIRSLQSRGVDCDNLLISGNAHVIMPYHVLLDGLSEENVPQRIGTTGRGIGPAYVDKTTRAPRGIRMWDLLDEQVLRERTVHQLALKNRLLTQVYGREPLDLEEVLAPVLSVASVFKHLVGDIRPLVRQALATDAAVVLEGAQGTYLDLDYGTYPYVTSSHPVSGGGCLGTGVPPTAISRVVMVAKAYTTRVGRGAFPTELTDEFGDLMRERGAEYGTTTGRPRRCGWLDIPLIRAAAQINGATEVAVTKLDVLDAFDPLRVCVGYRIGGEVLEYPPGNLDLLSEVEPVYEDLPGWREPLGDARSYGDLPAQAQAYVEYVEDLVGVRISTISVGPERTATIAR